MNKEELEKIYEDMYDKLSYGDFKSYVFEDIIPEVLKSIIDIRDEDWEKEDWEDYREDFKLWAIEWIERIKQKAKELYLVDL